MPTVETILRMEQENEGVAFLPRMCVEQDLARGLLREIGVSELYCERNIRLVYPSRRALSHAAKAFLEVVKSAVVEPPATANYMIENSKRAALDQGSPKDRA